MNLGAGPLLGNLGTREESIHYVNLNIYVPSIEIYSRTLYLVQAEELPQEFVCKKNLGCILLPTDKSHPAPRGPDDALCEWVSWDAHINLFNRIQNVLSLDNNANEFQQFLFSSLASNQSVKSIVHRAAQILRNPVQVLDPCFRLIAMDDYGCEVDDPFWKDIKESGILSAESMKMLKEFGITDYMEFAKGPAYLDTQCHITMPRIGRKLYSPQGEFLGTLAVYQAEQTLTHEDYIYVDKLGAMLSVKRRYQPYLNDNEKHFFSAFRLLLNGGKMDELLPDEKKTAITIAREYAHMRICYLNLATDPATARQGEFYRSHLFAGIPGVYTMRFHKDIVALICAKSHEELADSIRRIQTSLKETTLFAGVSRDFNNLSETRTMYLEAKQTLVNSERYATGNQMILHEDIALFAARFNRIICFAGLLFYHGSCAASHA